MTPLTVEDVLPVEAFAAIRPRMEREVMAAKSARRVAVGPNMTLLFENRLTVLWQIQEMCRVEGIVRPDAVAHEVDTYNALLPGPAELSATLLVEYDDPDERTRMLRRLHGLDAHLKLRVAGAADAVATFDREQFDGERISSVQFVRFPMGADHLAAFRDLGRAAEIVVDHPAYAAVSRLGPATRGALVEDLTP